MSDTGDNSDENAKLSAAAVLGLKDPPGGEWARLHGSSYSQLFERAPARFVVQLVGIALVLYLFLDTVNWLAAYTWAAAALTSAVVSGGIDFTLRDTNIRALDRFEHKRHAAAAFVQGCVWSVPIVFFGPLGSAGAEAMAWSYVVLIVIAASVSRTGVPLGTMVFCMTIAVFCGTGLAFKGAYFLAGISFATGLLSAVGAFESAYDALSGALARQHLQKKTEVVSLLLREYEETNTDWLFELDVSRRLIQASPRLCAAMQDEPENLEGKPFLQLISGPAWQTGIFPPSVAALNEKLKQRQNFSDLEAEVWVAGQRRFWQFSGTALFDEDGRYTGFRGVGSDVTAQRESNEKIAYLARFDPLTTLPNRMMLNESLGEALRYAEKWRTRCGFLMIDLDRFKAVNDSLGHMTGDQLLGQVAARLKSLMSDNEVCGRLGGDEFAVVVRDASDKAYVQRLAERVIDHLSEPYQVDRHILYVGASVGAAYGPRDGESVEELMRNADLSLYRAKDEGGGAFIEYQPSLHASAEERRQLEFALRGALKNDEFLLHYQPVVDANTHEIVSFEALLRWTNPEHGFVSPAKFIPLAEDTRLIVPIGKWVMARACAEAVNWPSTGKVNVNVSPEQLVEPDFATSVVQALSRSGLSPDRLEIEVTESIFLRDANVAARALEQVMALGCSVALDDFGTGYSSLGYLRKLKFSTIKVDRSFVQGASQKSAESEAIINAVVAMAKSLKMTTTAEGVETEDEAEMIRRMGCTKIQGFHFGRPMPAQDALALFSGRLELRA